MRVQRLIQSPELDPTKWYASGQRVGAVGAKGSLCIPTGNGGHACFMVDLPDGWISRYAAATAGVNPNSRLAADFGFFAPEPAPVVSGFEGYIQLPNGLFLPRAQQFPQYPEVGFLDDLLSGLGDLIGGIPIVGPLVQGVIGGGHQQQPQQPQQQPQQQGGNPLLSSLGSIAGTALGGPGLGTALGGLAGNLLGGLLQGGGAGGGAGGGIGGILQQLLGGLLGGGAQQAQQQAPNVAPALAGADVLLQALRGMLGPQSGQVFGAATAPALQLLNNGLGAFQARALAQLGDPTAAAALEAARQGVSRDIANAINMVDALMGLRSS